MAHLTYQVAINPEQLSPSFHVLFAGEAQTAPGHLIEPQVLDYYLVHYVMSGKGTYTCNGSSYTLSAGQCFFIFPGELESYAADHQDPWKYRWIAFSGAEAAQLLGERNITSSNPIITVSDHKRMSILFYQVFQTLHEAAAGCAIKADGYFRIILGNLQSTKGLYLSQEKDEPSSEAEQQLEKAIRWLTYQYAQPISLTQMAQSLGYHRTHLSKLFRQRTGLSPMQYLMKIRMERAKSLLLQPLTIQQVASSVGFHDPLYFSKQFKKWYGVPPSEYKANLSFNPCE